MIAGLSAHLPQTLVAGLAQQGVSAADAHRIAMLPPVVALRGVPRRQPDPRAARAGRCVRCVAGGEPAGARGPRVLPEPDLRAVPSRTDRRLHGRGRAYAVCRRRLVFARVAGVRGRGRAEVTRKGDHRMPISVIDERAAFVVIDLQKRLHGPRRRRAYRAFSPTNSSTTSCWRSTR